MPGVNEEPDPDEVCTGLLGAMGPLGYVPLQAMTSLSISLLCVGGDILSVIPSPHVSSFLWHHFWLIQQDQVRPSSCRYYLEMA